MTDNQALNLGMAMHLLFNSLSYGRDIVNKSMECHGHDQLLLHRWTPHYQSGHRG